MHTILRADSARSRILPRAVVVATVGAAVAAGALFIPAAANAAANPGPVQITRLGGADRYGTAQAIAQEGWKPVTNGSASNTVYLAYGLSFPDALAGVPLAVASNAPILLTNSSDTLPSATAIELTALNPTNVVLLGGTGVISAKLQASLAAQGYNVTRDSGADRYATAAEVGTALEAAKPSTTAVLATGTNFADALSIGPVAGDNGWPIVFTEPNSLPSVTQKFITDNKITNVVIVGGTGAVSDAVQAQLAKLGVATTTRLGGTDRYATSVQIAQYFASQFTKGTLSVATGADFADALTGGVLSAKDTMPLLLLNPATGAKQNVGATATTPGLSSNEVYVYGAEGALPSAAVQAVTGIVPGTVAVSGNATVNSVLTANPGTWAPTSATLSYQWLRDGSAIDGATSSTYTVTTADVGHTISLQVSGNASGYTATATSAPTAQVPATVAFTVSGSPSISGTAESGKTLTANAGTWVPTPTTVSYQWFRGSAAISGATGSTYVLTTADIGSSVSVKLTVAAPGVTAVTEASQGVTVAA